MRRRCCQSLKCIPSITLTGLTVLARSGWRTAQRDSVGRRAVGAPSWPKRYCAAFFCPAACYSEEGPTTATSHCVHQKKKKRNHSWHAAPRWFLATLRVVLQQEWCWEPLPQDHLPQVTARPDGQTNTGDLCSSTSWFRGFYVRGIINSFAGSKRENSAHGRKPSDGPRNFGMWRRNVKR